MLALNIKEIEDDKVLFDDMFLMPKLDGVRAIKQPDGMYSRNGEKLRNKKLHTIFYHIPDGMEGELFAEGLTFNQIESAACSFESDVIDLLDLYVFDIIIEDKTAEERYEYLKELVPNLSKCKLIPHFDYDKNLYEAMQEKAVDRLCEGVMLKHKKEKYKHGRSGKKKQELLKWKPRDTSEAIIISCVEEMKNTAVATKDALNRTKRSNTKTEKEPKGILGAFVVKNISDGVLFRIGTGEGLTKEYRKELWDSRDSLVGKVIEYSHEYGSGHDKPRFPSFLRFRDESLLG